jgi:hypothetical protein
LERGLAFFFVDFDAAMVTSGEDARGSAVSAGAASKFIDAAELGSARAPDYCAEARDANSSHGSSPVWSWRRRARAPSSTPSPMRSVKRGRRLLRQNSEAQAPAGRIAERLSFTRYGDRNFGPMRSFQEA